VRSSWDKDFLVLGSSRKEISAVMEKQSA